MRRIDTRQRIFLVGTTLAAGVQQRHSAGERAKERILLQEYQQIWSTRYGDVTVTLLVRDP